MTQKPTLLVTGAGPNGVTGRLIKEYFEGRCRVLAPGSRDLDLTDDDAVRRFFDGNSVDYVIHCATFRPGTQIAHKVDEVLESNLRMYFVLASMADHFRRMVYFGSGAEYDKSRPVVMARETDFGRSIPADKYGFGKFVMNCDARRSQKIVNFRLFGTINPYERFTKNIVSNLCVKAIKGLPLTLNRDCRFSFVDIADVLPLLEKALFAGLRHHDYNITSGPTYLLSDIAGIVSRIAGVAPVTFREPGLNKEYTGSNARLCDELAPVFTPMEESVRRVYDHYLAMAGDIDTADIDGRWK